MKNKEVEELVAIALIKIKQFCQNLEYPIAESFCKQLLRVDKENDEAWFLMGVACGCQGKKQEAIKAFENAADLAKVPENRGYALQMKERLL